VKRSPGGAFERRSSRSRSTSGEVAAALAVFTPLLRSELLGGADLATLPDRAGGSRSASKRRRSLPARWSTSQPVASTARCHDGTGTRRRATSSVARRVGDSGLTTTIASTQPAGSNVQAAEAWIRRHASFLPWRGGVLRPVWSPLEDDRALPAGATGTGAPGTRQPAGSPPSSELCSPPRGLAHRPSDVPGGA